MISLGTSSGNNDMKTLLSVLAPSVLWSFSRIKVGINTTRINLDESRWKDTILGNKKLRLRFENGKAAKPFIIS